MHVRDVVRQIAEPLPQEPAQGLVRQCHRRDPERRLRGHFQSVAAAARAARDARIRLHADLRLPRHSRRAAHQPDRHRTVQVRRAEAERVDQAREEPGLLEEGPALSRRHRIHDHPEPLDRDPRFRRRQVRHHVPDRGHDPAAQGREGAGTERRMRARTDQRLDQPDHQPRERTVRQCRRAPCGRAVARPQVLHPDHGRGQFGCRRRDAAAARRRVGHAARRAENDQRLRRRREEEPRRGPQADGEGAASDPTSGPR